MEQYFCEVVDGLDIDDLQLLGFLYDNDCTASFKAIRTHDVLIKCGFTQATFRKSLYRLVSNKFIGIVAMKRQQSIFITVYGITAIKNSVGGVI